MIIENYLEMKTPMSIFYIIAIVFCVIIIATVIYIMGKNLDERKKHTNVSLPDLDLVEKEERIKRMKKNSDDYEFSTKKINPSKITTGNEEEIDNSKYIAKNGAEFDVEDFDELLQGNSYVPNIVGEISLPDLESASNTPKVPSKDDIVPPKVNISKKSEALTEQSGDNESNAENKSDVDKEEKVDTQSKSDESEFTLPEI